MGIEIEKNYGDWLVLKDLGCNKLHYVLCRCKCGRVKEICLSDLRRKKTTKCQSCANHKSNLRHGKWGTSEYRTWQNMINRCYNKKYKQYKDYGGRGIRVCDKWRNSFMDFLADMGLKPNEKLSIDRINNNGNYEPQNCRWTTTKIQNNNKRKKYGIS